MHFTSNTGTAAANVGPATVVQQLTVCVPPRRPAEILLTAEGSSQISGSEATPLTAVTPRKAGVLVRSIQLADAAGPTCRPA